MKTRLVPAYLNKRSFKQSCPCSINSYASLTHSRSHFLLPEIGSLWNAISQDFVGGDPSALRFSSCLYFASDGEKHRSEIQPGGEPCLRYPRPPDFSVPEAVCLARATPSEFLLSPMKGQTAQLWLFACAGDNLPQGHLLCLEAVCPSWEDFPVKAFDLSLKTPGEVINCTAIFAKMPLQQRKEVGDWQSDGHVGESQVDAHVISRLSSQSFCKCLQVTAFSSQKRQPRAGINRLLSALEHASRADSTKLPCFKEHRSFF